MPSIGADVHLGGGVGIGGVLEPLQASPVIVEDGAFIGSVAIVVEGVRIGREAVLGAGVVLTASTRIIDVTGAEPVELRGSVPPRSWSSREPAPSPSPPESSECPAPSSWATKESTDRKTSLNDALRTHAVAV